MRVDSMIAPGGDEMKIQVQIQLEATMATFLCTRDAFIYRALIDRGFLDDPDDC